MSDPYTREELAQWLDTASCFEPLSACGIAAARLREDGQRIAELKAALIEARGYVD